MISQIDAIGLKKKLDANEDFILLDVRRPEELNIAQIKDAINIEMNMIPQSLDQLSEDKEIIVICRSGMRSMQVAAYLAGEGYTKVTNLQGGILAWANQIDPSMPTY